MITDSFDDKSEAKINPRIQEPKIKCDACIITFSNVIEEYVLKKYECEEVAEIKCVTGITPIYKLKYKNKLFTFYKTYLGASASVRKN